MPRSTHTALPTPNQDPRHIQAGARETPLKRDENIPTPQPCIPPRRPTTAADITEDIEPPSKKFLATPPTLVRSLPLLHVQSVSLRFFP